MLPDSESFELDESPEISPNPRTSLHGRGAAHNPKNRFESLELEWKEPSSKNYRQSQFFTDYSKSILSKNDSPDVPFRFSLNPYRGCEHGCTYCYARPTHEYLGFSAGLDFETKILIKENAPQLLRKQLSLKSWEPQIIALSGVTDPYQPIEKKMGITRKCLEVLHEAKNPVAIITKNQLINRDIDLLSDMAQHSGIAVMISLTTLDENLARKMEPRTASPTLRLKTITKLRKAGVPVGILMAPLIPGLTDSELPTLYKAAFDHGATRADYVMLRLPHGVTELFSDWLERSFPEKRKKILHQIQSTRGGKMYNSDFKQRMSGQGLLATQIEKLHQITYRRLGINQLDFPLDASQFVRPSTDGQMNLF